LALWIFVPQSREGAWVEETDLAERIATTSGFETVNLGQVFTKMPIEQIRLAEWDEHPNKLGHRMLADALLKDLMRPDSPVALAIKEKGAAAATAAPAF